ncbi:hypothetical protein EKO04_005639 [Ascochyta lentis]|uniref:Uncharacterized protein n=1 Tax=Ascochyta lentis TaxID=205686 RepID=A0A8H7MDJ4_9PLEO|nr:hypothetical protein EKO04_005639 [Ascochyta lentis]
MANGEISLAGAALAVALTALAIAVGQLLQQVFSTAEGYRRCQHSVLGPWARKTRLTWRWSQFRFEVKFTTPDIILQTNVPIPASRKILQRTLVKREIVAIDHSGTNTTSIPVEDREETSTDQVGWISLLKQLEHLQRATWEELKALDARKSFERPTTLILSPAMVLREWSWDFMPPEVVRPLATTTVGTLVVLAHRLGMAWRDLQPSRGYLRAEGNGHTINSTTIRGFGILVQYTFDESYLPSYVARPHTRIHTEAADKLACGIIPGCQALDLPDVHIVPSAASTEPNHSGTIIHSSKTLSASSLAMIRGSLESIGVLEEIIELITSQDGYFQLMCDLRSMFCPFLPLRGSSITTVSNALCTDVEFFATHWARIILRRRLEQHIMCENRSTYLRGLLGHLVTYAARWPHFFYESLHFHMGQQSRCPADLIEFAHDVFDETTAYFVEIRERHSIEYKDLVLAHLHLGAAAWKKSKKALDRGLHRDDFVLQHGSPANDLVEVFHCYVDPEQLDVVVSLMEQKGIRDRDLIVEAWWTLVVRAIFQSCTLRFLPFTEFPPVASAFHGSRMPVYIT